MHHLPSHVAARDVWQWNPYTVETAALPEIEVVERAGPHAHQRLARPRDGIGEVLLEAEDVQTAVLPDHDRAHARMIQAGARGPR